jgi:peptide/nickel transport system permease protein
MASDISPELVGQPEGKPSGVWTFILSRHWTFRVGIVLLTLLLSSVALADLIAPHDPAKQNLLDRLQSPNLTYWFGTDHLGRDLFSRLLVGGQFTVTISAVTVVLTLLIGTWIGIVAGRRGGLFDELAMRTVDLLISVPDVVVAIFLIGVFGPGTGTLIIALTLTGWTPFARLARGLSKAVNATDYVRAAEVLGMPQRFILFRHILPNIIRPLAAVTFIRFGHKLITVGGLSFLGLGVQPPDSDWGLMIAAAHPYLERAPMLMIAPGLAIFLSALSVTWIGHGLEIKGKDT